MGCCAPKQEREEYLSISNEPRKPIKDDKRSGTPIKNNRESRKLLESRQSKKWSNREVIKKPSIKRTVSPPIKIIDSKVTFDKPVYYFNVTDVATAIGYNKYKSVESVPKTQITDKNIDYYIKKAPRVKGTNIEHVQEGIDKEREDLELLSQKLDEDIFIDTRMKYRVFELSFALIKIGGRIDGFLEDDTIIETKHRAKRFFDRIPIYERIQCECYMRIMETNCIHVQNYAGMSIVTDLEPDDKLWDKVLRGLGDFIKYS